MREGVPDRLDPVRRATTSSSSARRGACSSCTSAASRARTSTARATTPGEQLAGGLGAFFLLTEPPERFGLPAQADSPIQENVPAATAAGLAAGVRGGGGHGWRSFVVAHRRRAGEPPARARRPRRSSAARDPRGRSAEGRDVDAGGRHARRAGALAPRGRGRAVAGQRRAGRDARWSFLYDRHEVRALGGAEAERRGRRAARAAHARRPEVTGRGRTAPSSTPPVWTWEVPALLLVRRDRRRGSSFVALACDAAGDDALRRGRAQASRSAPCCPCAPLLILDLGRPQRFLNMLRIFKPRSPMSMGAWCLSAFSGAAAAAVGADLLGAARGSRRARAPATALLGTYLGSYTGVLLASTAVPVWARSRALLPPIFICTAAAGGAAANRLVLAGAGHAGGASDARGARHGRDGRDGRRARAVGGQRAPPRAARPRAGGGPPGPLTSSSRSGSVRGGPRAALRAQARRPGVRPRRERPVPARRRWRSASRWVEAGARIRPRRRGGRPHGAPPQHALTVAPGTLFCGRYRVVRRLGTGGTATVYLAEDQKLGREVAVKRLHGAEVTEATAERLRREARIMASLRHPNLVTVLDMLTEDDDLYLIMEYVAGGTLREVVDEAPLDAGRTLELLRPVAAALDHAHEHGIVHRDVKPSNVLVGGGGTVKLADLGLATAAEITRITPPGSILGTPAYMAPEQAQPVPCTPATDIYALATIAFQLLSGTLPRTGSTAMAVLRQAASMPPPDLRERRPGTPAAAAEALSRGMALEPGDRHPTASALLADLADGLRAGEQDPRRRPERTRAMRPAQRRRTPADVLAAERAPAPAPRPRRRRPPGCSPRSPCSPPRRRWSPCCS